MNSGITSCVGRSVMEQEWIKALLEEYENEVKEEAYWPIILLKSTARRLTWYLCNLFGLNRDGIPASACRLLERYLSRHIHKCAQICRDERDWEQHNRAIGWHYYLLAASCIQLASKMANFSAPLTTSVVHSVLLQEGVVYTKADITMMEIIIYKTLDFRIPLWTTLQCAQFFASYVGINATSTMEAVAIVIDLAEYNRDVVQFQMQKWYGLSNEQMTVATHWYYSIHNIHICAASVCAAVRYLRIPGDLVPTLARLTRCAPSFLNAITIIILTHAIPVRADRTC